MNWIKVFKIFSIIFGSAILISGICIGLWIFLSQGKDTSSVPTPNLNVTEEKIDNFNNILNKKGYNYINRKKFNEKNTYEENKSTLINPDEKIKLENKNYDTKIENTSSKPVSKKNFERKRGNINIQDEIGDLEIKKAIPKIENRFFFKYTINNSVANNNDSEKVSGINNSLEETFLPHIGGKTTEEMKIYHKNSDINETSVNLDADRPKESLSSGLIMNKTKLMNSEVFISTEKNLNTQINNTTEKSHDDILRIKSIKLPINNGMIDEVDKNESKFNINNEETAHDRRNDVIKSKKKIKLLNGGNFMTTETNLDNQIKIAIVADSDNINAINNSVIYNLKLNFSLALNTSEESGAKSLDLYSELNVGTEITTEKTGNESETNNTKFLNSENKEPVKEEIIDENVPTNFDTTEQNILINKNDSTELNLKTNINSSKQNLSSALDFKKTPLRKINKEEITTEKIFVNDNTSLLINGSITSAAGVNSSNIDNIEVDKPLELIIKKKASTFKNFSELSSMEVTKLLLNNSSSIEKNLSSSVPTIREEITTEKTPDIFNITQNQNHDNKSETLIEKNFFNDTEDISEKKTLNNDLKKLEILNSTCNFTKCDKSKDLMIVMPTLIDSEDINSNKKIETASGNFNDSNLYFNNESDRVIIVTPIFISEENILNKDGNTSIGIKQKLDDNLKNSTNDDENELNSPEISSSDTDYSSILYDDIDDNTDDEIQSDEDNRKCYEELGCLSITPTWYHTLNRNLNKLPLLREFINTSIIIYTREDPTEGQVIVVSKIKSVVELINFNPKRKTKFIIHGFNSSPHVPWATITYGLKLNDVHLIGHSLGAHIAGYAGEKLHGKIGRISGLDPAMPDFEKMPIHVRLDSTDAKLVDVIHTDSLRIVRLGIYQPCGHLDFYPNDGDDQPGCSELFFGEVCDHTRAIKLFTESINSKCQFIAHKCPRYEDFIGGKCFLCNSTNSLNCGIMGYHADKSPALLRKLTPEESAINSILQPKFFISTGDKYPYCRRHYRITIKLARPIIAKFFLQGFINVTLYGDNGIINNMELTPNGERIKLLHGSKKQIVALPPENTEYFIGKIRKVELSWIYDSKYPNFFYNCFFCNDVLYVDSIIVDILELLPQWKKREMDLSSELCSIQGPKNYAAISSGSSAPFVDNCYLSK
ncbi:hypothetical protein G9C98_000423 [Cotesia typhae]|uniref:phospholipase A1 n=1 Tax=Cotesia typhae TaxID=2053667 RepID=A0A8J5VBN8_9HYME|nr:hypothetical protein G9C98_000423 [Cotesia typhae]